jgi:hypothetical protein
MESRALAETPPPSTAEAKAEVTKPAPERLTAKELAFFKEFAAKPENVWHIHAGRQGRSVAVRCWIILPHMLVAW